jgi:succinate-acetate transporter protein
LNTLLAGVAFVTFVALRPLYALYALNALYALLAAWDYQTKHLRRRFAGYLGLCFAARR